MTHIDAGPPTQTEEWADRADCFRAAHALIKTLPWGDYEFDVLDVLNVARFMVKDD